MEIRRSESIVIPTSSIKSTNNKVEAVIPTNEVKNNKPTEQEYIKKDEKGDYKPFVIEI